MNLWIIICKQWYYLFDLLLLFWVNFVVYIQNYYASDFDIYSIVNSTHLINIHHKLILIFKWVLLFLCSIKPQQNSWTKFNWRFFLALNSAHVADDNSKQLPQNHSIIIVFPFCVFVAPLSISTSFPSALLSAHIHTAVLH